MLPLCHLQQLPTGPGRPSIFTIFDLYQMYVPLVHTQFMGCLTWVVVLDPCPGCCASCVKQGVSRRQKEKQ
eukprot:1152602-Pelagomonas_calceolata.AAC.1